MMDIIGCARKDGHVLEMGVSGVGQGRRDVRKAMIEKVSFSAKGLRRDAVHYEYEQQRRDYAGRT